MPEGTRFQVLAPVVRTRKGEFVDLFDKLHSQGYSRVRVDGVVHPLTDAPKLKKQKHDIEVVVDRLTVKPSAKQRLTDSVETALNLADGIVVLEFVDHDHDSAHREQRFSEKLACPNGHPLAVDDLEPRSFSFSPLRRVPRVHRPWHPQGGRSRPRHPRSGSDPGGGRGGAVVDGPDRRILHPDARRAGRLTGFDVDTPWSKLPARARKAILEGCDEQVHVRYRNRYGRTRSYYADFEGVMAFLERRMEQTDSEQMKEALRGLHARRSVPGLRRRTSAEDPRLATLAAGEREKSIAEVVVVIADCADFLSELTLGPREQAIAGQVLKEIQSRLGFLLDVGLEYLSLSRACPAVRRNAFGWPRRSARAWSGCCMCSTNRRSVCISVIIAG